MKIMFRILLAIGTVTIIPYIIWWYITGLDLEETLEKINEFRIKNNV